MNKITKFGLTYNVVLPPTITKSLTYCVSLVSTASGYNTSKPNPYDEFMSGMKDRQDRMCNLAHQQSRTLNKKLLFLEAYSNRACFIITAACNMAGIKSRKTIYNWMETDPEFKEAMGKVFSMQVGFVEDMLMALIVKGNSSCTRYFLDRMHPAYKPQSRLSERDKGYLKEQGLGPANERHVQVQNPQRFSDRKKR